MIVPGPPLYEEARTGSFVLPGTFALLEELGTIVSEARFTNCFFTAKPRLELPPHPGSDAPGREKILRLIDDVVRRGDASLLRPESMRGL